MCRPLPPVNLCQVLKPSCSSTRRNSSAVSITNGHPTPRRETRSKTRRSARSMSSTVAFHGCISTTPISTRPKRPAGSSTQTRTPLPAFALGHRELMHGQPRAHLVVGAIVRRNYGKDWKQLVTPASNIGTRNCTALPGLYCWRKQAGREPSLLPASDPHRVRPTREIAGIARREPPRLWGAEASDVLAPVYGWFTQGFRRRRFDRG